MSRRVAVVTGAGSGIGREVTHALLADGWAVVLAGRRADTLDASLAGRRRGRRDARRPDRRRRPGRRRRAVRRGGRALRPRRPAVQQRGPFGPPAPFEDYEREDWRALVDTNLSGAFYCAQAAYRAMKAQDPRGGRIINNGSISAHVPRPHAAAYTATKHAITGLTKRSRSRAAPTTSRAGRSTSATRRPR